jgi:D-alanyl-D-alanine carboxypeptidase
LPADFEPDEDYGYSNTNYFLLAELIDEVVGFSHFQYIKEEILIPLELNNTYGSLQEVDVNDFMSGYYVGYDPDLRDRYFGSRIATAEAVDKFLRAINDGSLLNEDEQAIYSSIYEYEHTGLLPGYYSIARYHEDIDTVVIQFVNTIGGTSMVPLLDTGGGTKVMVSNVVYNRIVRILRQ